MCNHQWVHVAQKSESGSDFDTVPTSKCEGLLQLYLSWWKTSWDAELLKIPVEVKFEENWMLLRAIEEHQKQ